MTLFLRNLFATSHPYMVCTPVGHPGLAHGGLTDLDMPPQRLLPAGCELAQCRSCGVALWRYPMQPVRLSGQPYGWQSRRRQRVVGETTCVCVACFDEAHPGVRRV